MELGAGMNTKDADINFLAGVVLYKKKGVTVRRGNIIAEVYVNDEVKAETGVSEIVFPVARVRA